MSKKEILVVVIVALLIALGLGVWYNRSHDTSASATVEDSEGAEIKVTPQDKMPVRTAEGTPSIDLETYRLQVGGLVDRELSLSFEDIGQLPAEERLMDMDCVEGWSVTGLWKGTRLSDVLDSAGLAEGAETVVFSSPGGYTTSLTLAEIEETDPLLCYGVNGEPLTVDHGFPLRLVVPGRYGYKWIKWVVDIEVISGEYEGYWEDYGYPNDAVVR